MTEIKLCDVDDVEVGQPFLVRVEGREPFAVYNVDGKIYVSDDFCTHGRASLADEGELDGFMAADDKKSQRQKKRLLAMLEKFVATLDGDALVLQGVEEPKQPSPIERSRHRDFVPPADHSLLPCSPPITRFTDVLRDSLAPAA